MPTARELAEKLADFLFYDQETGSSILIVRETAGTCEHIEDWDRDQFIADIEPIIAAHDGELRKELDGWHRVVVDCERVLGLEGSATSPGNSNLTNVVRDNKVGLAELRQRCERYESALTEYANSSNWMYNSTTEGNDIWKTEDDGWEVAQEALNGELAISDWLRKPTEAGDWWAFGTGFVEPELYRVKQCTRPYHDRYGELMYFRQRGELDASFVEGCFIQWWQRAERPLPPEARSE